MVHNGILLIFTRLATVCLCFLDVRFLCLSLSHPPESCTYRCLFQNLSKPKQGRRTSQVCLPPRHVTVPDMGLLFMGLNLHPPQYIMYITLKASAFPACLQLCWGFLFPPHLAFCFHCLRLLICPSASVYMCVESLLEFAGQGGALKEMDFSQH